MIDSFDEVEMLIRCEENMFYNLTHYIINFFRKTIISEKTQFFIKYRNVAEMNMKYSYANDRHEYLLYNMLCNHVLEIPYDGRRTKNPYVCGSQMQSNNAVGEMPRQSTTKWVGRINGRRNRSDVTLYLWIWRRLIAPNRRSTENIRNSDNFIVLISLKINLSCYLWRRPVAILTKNCSVALVEHICLWRVPACQLALINVFWYANTQQIIHERRAQW